MSDEKEHDIFLSYSHADKEWVHQLANKIENEDYEGRKLKVFLDEWDITPGKNIVESLQDGLQKSRYIAPIISKNSIHAEWPNAELSTAILSDPSGRKGTIIPLWLGGCEIPPILRIRLVLYCDNPVSYEKSYKKLIATLTNHKSSRGLTKNVLENTPHIEQPHLYCEDDINEKLVSNLFPVIDMPETIWSSPTDYTQKYIFDLLREKMTGILPTFIVKNKKIFCFWNMNDVRCPFRDMSNVSVIKTENVRDWIKTEERSLWLIELLNKGLGSHCRALRLKFDKEHKRYYFSPRRGEDFVIRWNTGKRSASRTVARQYNRGKSNYVFWIHQSMKARFMIIDEDIFLQINPGWYFTRDGINPLPSNQIGPLSTRRTSVEYNATVFRHIRFLSSYLSRQSRFIQISLGDNTCKIDTTPGMTELNKGLEGDYTPTEKIFEITHDEIPVIEELRNPGQNNDN